jgi:hypothetical protein
VVHDRQMARSSAVILFCAHAGPAQGRAQHDGEDCDGKKQSAGIEATAGESGEEGAEKGLRGDACS